MRAGILLTLLPFLGLSSTALQLPHFPSSPQDALNIADSLVHSQIPSTPGEGIGRTSVGNANDINLESVGEEFTVLTHKKFPDHRVRIKSTTGWCDPDVRSYTGYLDVGFGKDLFFYFFESRSKPAEDPVVMWINGGPGCSSALGLLMELGPCSVKDDPKTVNDTKVNPYSWNNNANIFFLDQPIGVGFSHAENGQAVGTTEAAAVDVQAFISIFFETFKEFEGRPFHMSGESYGGRYLPVFASAVIDGNKALIAEGKTPINLQSVLIGNGGTDFYSLEESYFDYLCTPQDDMAEPVLSIERCVAMAQAVPKCHKYTQKSCIESHDYTACTIAMNYCQDSLGGLFVAAQVNPYDVTKSCTVEQLSDSLCYPVTKKITKYLDLPDVRKALGVDSTVGNYSSCNGPVGMNFALNLDLTGQTWLYVAQLLHRGIRVLNYVGQRDFICNHVANEKWMEKLEWTGKAQYNAAEFGEWTVDGKAAGTYKTSGNLTMLKIKGAGHMVPYDKPLEALTMFNSWLSADALSK
ncbi:hypothetical protein IAR55_006171 [Kwoniella newhampshirensis]|uniref:Carboxypeptidase n=1 Tax=Kwoniella newhampshirensis TaxID=1651941 RepID=A0AAW0YS46_9TREE